MADQNPLLIFMHLPKSGGTTVSAHLARHLTMDEDFIEFSNWGEVYRRKNCRTPFARRALAERQNARVLVGHNVNYGIHLLCPGREPRYLTSVREPAERCVSAFNFQHSRGHAPACFEEWYDTQYRINPRSSAVRFFAERWSRSELEDAGDRQMFDMAKTLLRQFWMVTTTRQLNELLSEICQSLDISMDWQNQRVAGVSGPLNLPNHPSQGERIRRHQTLDDQIRQRVYADFPYDLDLYQWIEEGQWKVED
tara:strand:+ start:9252 stop:10007 length:756 start_codon:yes stop_codon:yes gene_type:complete